MKKIDPYEPPNYIISMQDLVKTCDKNYYLKIVKAHQDYYYLVEKNKGKTKNWFHQVDLWIEMLSELSLERFNEDLTLDQSTVTISYSKHITKDFKTKELRWIDLYKVPRSEFNYSSGVFRNGYRNTENWLFSSDVFILDIDDKLTIVDATKRLVDLGWKSLIVTTKSHQKIKDKQPAVDRFRIFIALKQILTVDKPRYVEIFKYIKQSFPEADDACKDPTRFYYPGGNNAKYIYIEGDLFDASEAIIEKKQIKYKPKQNNEVKDFEPIKTWIKDNYVVGSRRPLMFRVGKWMIDLGYNKLDIKDIFEWMNTLAEPLTDQQIDHQLKSIFTY